VFFALLVVISITDLSHRLVPRRLIYGALTLIVPLLVATSAVDHTWHSLDGALIGGLVAFGLFFAIWWFIPRGMGYGDVRLAGLIGIATGYLSLLHAYLAFLGGFIIGLLFGVGMMVVFGSGRKTRIPFAPALAIGAVIGVFWGAGIAQTLFHASS
jgi:leader peptidase (prepilin peptidase)/N-methyltransferase